jgi:hypothetical protein
MMTWEQAEQKLRDACPPDAGWTIYRASDGRWSEFWIAVRGKAVVRQGITKSKKST